MDRSLSTIIDEIAEDDEVIRQDIRNAESNPSDPDSWAKLADRLSQKGYYEQSLECYRRALELNPNNISLWYNRGLALSNIGNYDEAILCFDEAIKINPNIVYAWNSKGHAFNSQGKFREAIKAYDRVIELDPKNVNARYNRGLTLSNIGSFDEAIQSFDKALEIDKKNVGALNAKGLALEELGKFDEAIQSYDKVLEIDENNTDALNAKGLSLERLGKGDDAVQYYDKVTQVYNVRIEENSKDGYYLLESSKFREAIKAYDRVLEIDPNNVSAWYNKGLALNNIGKYNEAIQSFDKVLEIDKKNVGALNAKALNAKGLALEELGRFDELGRLGDLGRFDEAIQSFDKVLEIDEKNIDALYNKSYAHYAIGRHQGVEGKSDLSQNSYREAVGGLERIIGLESTNIRALELLRELFSNYSFEYNKALDIDAKILAIESTALRKAKLAEDLIKVGKNKKGRQLAFEAKRDIPPEKIKRQSCVRLLILTSYFLEGNSIKGNEELGDFLRFYEVLENFKVEEKEWNFNGLIKEIDSQSSNSTSRQILIDIIDLLRGKGNREKILSKLLSKVSESGVQIGHKAHTKLKIIVPIVFAAALVTGALAFYFIEMASAEPCGVPDSKPNVYDMGVPADIVVHNNVVYVAHSNQKAISAIDCNNRGIVEQIDTPGFVTDLSIDKKTNILYADTKGANGTIALAIDGGRFGVNSPLEKFINKWIRPVIKPLPVYKDSNIISEIKNGNTQNASDFDGNENFYVLSNNQSTIYGVGDKDTASTIPLKLIASQDAKHTKPHDMAFNPDKNIVYLATDYRNGTASISVINTTNHNHSLFKTITGPIRSIDSIALDSKTNKLYITDPSRDTVSVIDGSNNKIVKNIPVGKVPRDLFVDDINGMIYVANSGSNAVSVIDSTKDEVVKIIYLPENSGQLSSVSADPVTKMVYIGLSRDGLTGFIQMINSTIPRWSNYIQVGPTPSDMVFESNASKIYLAKTKNGSVSVLDTNNNHTKDIFLKGEYPFKLAINPNSKKVYVANFDSNKVSVIDGKEDRLLENVSLSLPFKVSDIAVNSKLNKIYAIGGNNKNLSIIDGINDEVVKTETLSFFPSAIEVNPKTNRIYIANYDDWSLISIDSSKDDVTNGRVLNLTIPPESITLDPESDKIYVSSYTREDISQAETTHRSTSAAYPHRTEVQIIDGNNETVMFNNNTLKLGPKYGEVILAADPNNGDILAVPLSSDTILSWNMEQAEGAMNYSQGNLLNLKEVLAGTDPAQVAFDDHGKIYITNDRLNAILVDKLAKYEQEPANLSRNS